MAPYRLWSASGLDAAGENRRMVSALLAVTFACGLVIAVAHVANTGFVAPMYDVVANLLAFGCAVAASILLGHRVPALLSAVAIVCWLVLARRTWRARSASRRSRSVREVSGTAD
jgi:hypothetical protein